MSTARAAVTWLHYHPSDAVLAATALAALAGAAATHGSRWYVTPFFSTFIVIQLLLVSNYSAAAAQWRFSERVGLTIVGVMIAYLFGLVSRELVPGSTSCGSRGERDPAPGREVPLRGDHDGHR